ncbi:MAG: hypothetical protein WKF30_08910 [Pyrinomonadaceae bacterium]
MHGYDPITGTTDDAYLRYADGTPQKHAYGKDATKVVTDEAYVEAEKRIRHSQAFKDAIADANLRNKDRIATEGTQLESIFGANYKDSVFGKTRLGSRNNPTGVASADFTDGTMTAIYSKDATGKWNLFTMYPEPKQ